ncbi:hypothetical protein PVK06_012266 [Gossypium arboreum]|uniref:Uncharacterized protein n=1 Tax=Gossypium arboreum TaxID=29729 RepID=A0ABR0QB23_GOSAR|nr:hypothetical protein PVK06_012266 [Gossypium arboreum]
MSTKRTLAHDRQVRGSLGKSVPGSERTVCSTGNALFPQPRTNSAASPDTPGANEIHKGIDGDARGMICRTTNLSAIVAKEE